MYSGHRRLAGLGALAIAFVLIAQQGAGQAKLPGTVSFTLDFPKSEPSHYEITVASDGQGKYKSAGKISPQDESDDEYQEQFGLSPAMTSRIFDLAKRAGYFQRELDSKKQGLAFTGSKTLAYKDGEHSAQATYNYSQVPAVQELTAIFQNLSSTLEFGHRLEYYRRYQKLGLSDELKRMEEMAKSGQLVELAAVSPVLQKIADDKAIINVVRARAQRLLAMAESTSN
jgi:hypothetical protein